MRVSNRLRERMRERNRSMWKARAISLLVVLVCAGVYVSNYYHTDTDAVAAFLPDVDVERRELSDGSIAYVPDGATVGVIFYPGAKVEHTAYEPLMKALADQGILAITVKMPAKLAVLKQNAADVIREQFEGIKNWYMAGHSLGGNIAASYASKNKDSFDGVILLAAYSSTDISGSGLKVASIYGDQDKILNKENYDRYLNNLPVGLIETVIEGANHSGFGMYGEQSKDGTATITGARQIKVTAQIIAEFIK